MELSKDFMLNFKQHLTTLDSPSAIDLAVNILTMVVLLIVPTKVKRFVEFGIVQYVPV